MESSIFFRGRCSYSDVLKTPKKLVVDKQQASYVLGYGWNMDYDLHLDDYEPEEDTRGHKKRIRINRSKWIREISRSTSTSLSTSSSTSSSKTSSKTTDRVSTKSMAYQPSLGMCALCSEPPKLKKRKGITKGKPPACCPLNCQRAIRCFIRQGEIRQIARELARKQDLYTDMIEESFTEYEHFNTDDDEVDEDVE